MNQLVPFEGSLFDIMPGLFRSVSREAWAGPKMDVAETEGAYQLAIELPGASKDAIQVSVYENSVTVSAETPEPKAEEQQWLVRERSYGKFSRNLMLPEAVDEDASQARFADGVLYLTLQKKRASQVKRLAIH